MFDCYFIKREINIYLQEIQERLFHIEHTKKENTNLLQLMYNAYYMVNLFIKKI